MDAVERTADPSASLGMTKEGEAFVRMDAVERTADPSASTG
jgi:hypothetical protein